MATILVIEDDPPLRSFLEIALRRAGHTVVVAASGTEAMASSLACSPDLVITDVFMPEMDGIEVMKAFRKRDPAIRILVISGGGQHRYADLLRLATELGADESLAKPFTVDRLLTSVERVLGRPRPR